MNELIKWLTINPIAGTIALATFAIVILAAIIIYLVAFFQGRELSFWPPKIGSKPHKRSPSDTPKYSETASTAAGIMLEDRRAFSTPFEQRIASVQNVYLLGINLVGIVTHHESFIKERAKEGCVFRILMVDPRFFTDHDFPAYWTGGPRRKEHLLQSVEDLVHIRQETQNLKIRFLQLPPPFSLLMIDHETDHGEVRVEFYTYNENVSERPHFILKKEQNKYWYDFFVNEFDVAWNEASPYEDQNQKR